MRKQIENIARRLEQIARLSIHTGPPRPHSAKELGRNWWTRWLDALLVAVRRYVPPLHWAWVAIVAAGFYIYARLCALTVRLTTVGIFQWPDIPQPCVVAVWHGCVNALIAAVATRMPPAPLAILIAGDPRGDCLALLCKMLGLRVARVASEDGGWAALTGLAKEVEQGACAIITADGGGPARIAKAGAIALASTTATPILSVGADCRPAISMPNKWDEARTPLPFSRVSVAIRESRHYPDLTDPASVENARLWLQRSLNEAAETAKHELNSGLHLNK